MHALLFLGTINPRVHLTMKQPPVCSGSAADRMVIKVEIHLEKRPLVAGDESGDCKRCNDLV